ncbi:MAG: cyclic nucleotide-binding domain-containing protein [Granulosicoccus sp.]
MGRHYHIAVIGSGPAGLSAAARAAQKDQEAGRDEPTHVLLEAFSVHAKTIQQYQKGKYVMAEPGYLNLRSDCEFEQGTRENILDRWAQGLNDNGVNCLYNSEVTKVTGEQGNFAINVSDGTSLTAENIVLAIGVQGNPRKLGSPGSEHPLVQYQLDDPDEYHGEHIIVVGAGDAAIENAIALTANNKVSILNRKDEFSRAKEGNLNAILAAINDDKVTLECFYSSGVKLVEPDNSDPSILHVTLNTAEGEVKVEANRIIARLGAIPQRAFVESMGIEFPNKNPESMPELDNHYQSNVPGIYVVGALAGYPLIKQAMNQGYDVIEFIHGNDIDPADHPLLEYRFAGLPFRLDVNDQVDRLQQIIPMLRQLNSLQFRELLIESSMIASYPPGLEVKEAESRLAEIAKTLGGSKSELRITELLKEGDVIYEPGQFGTSFYTIVAGEVQLEKTLDSGELVKTTLKRGEFFGEMSLLSGHPRLEKAIAGTGCILIETPRRIMLKLISSNEEVAAGIEWIFIARELQRHFAPTATTSELSVFASDIDIVRMRAGDVLYKQGDEEECLYLIKSGGITLSKNIDGQEVFISQVRAGKMIGHLSLMGHPTRRKNAVATVESEAIRINRNVFNALMRRSDAPISTLQSYVTSQISTDTRMEVRPEAAASMDFLMDNGLGEATNTLIIDESLCVGCDNCEKACAETHGGITRLDRRLGPTFANIHIPTSCRHCEQPHCMKDCPPNAIRRAESGEVFINDSCIGCGNCQINCPYDVIRMVKPPPKKPGLITWMLLGLGGGPGESKNSQKGGDASAIKKAVKCDACVDLPTGPACVQACPTGAALRVGPAQYVELVEEKQR